MQLTQAQALRNAIFCVFSDTGDVEFDHLSAEDTLETMACLFKLLFAAEADEAKPNPETMNPNDRKTKPCLTLTDIAKAQGICSQVTRAPHPTAVAAIIDHLKLEPCEYEKAKDGTLYSSSVTFKVGNWLAENDYPNEITSVEGGRHLHVSYLTKEAIST